MRYFIAGGGEYGSHYVRKLRTAIAHERLELGEIVVVDRNRDCAATVEIGRTPRARIEVAEWNEFAVQVWKHRRDWIDDVWVPTPIAPHILSGWLVDRIELEVGQNARPYTADVQLPGLPFAQLQTDGRILLSHAPGTCPLDCIEPEVCTTTKGPRWWEMRDTIREMIEAWSLPLRPEAVAMFFCKHHCDVGGIRLRTIYEEADRVCAAARAGSPMIGVATFSSCHGVASMYCLGPDSDASS